MIGKRLDMQFSELCKKDVVCAKDCRKIGRIVDLEIDECKGCIRTIVVKDRRFFCVFECGEELEIPFSKICKIGPDIILVNL